MLINDIRKQYKIDFNFSDKIEKFLITFKSDQQGTLGWSFMLPLSEYQHCLLKDFSYEKIF